MKGQCLDVVPTDAATSSRCPRGSASLAVMLAFLLTGTGPVMAYDTALAGAYEKFYARFAEQETAKALQLIPVEKVVEAINKGEELVFLDVRTQREQSIIGLTYPGTLHIPMNEVFKPESLAQIPTDKRVIVTCHSGVRCTAVALTLRSLGFPQVFSMKGGLTELMKYLDATTAFPVPPAVAK